MRVLGVVLSSVVLGLVCASSAFADAVIVRSPSNNIGCGISASGVRCDIRNHDWTAPPKPRSCQLDWGGGMIVDRKGRGSFVCAGDTVLGQGRHLPYGSSVQRGRFRCTSKTNGMRCVNRRNGHGFLLSRQQARRF